MYLEWIKWLRRDYFWASSSAKSTMIDAIFLHWLRNIFNSSSVIQIVKSQSRFLACSKDIIHKPLPWGLYLVIEWLSTNKMNSPFLIIKGNVYYDFCNHKSNLLFTFILPELILHLWKLRSSKLQKSVLLATLSRSFNSSSESFLFTLIDWGRRLSLSEYDIIKSNLSGFNLNSSNISISRLVRVKRWSEFFVSSTHLNNLWICLCKWKCDVCKIG